MNGREVLRKIAVLIGLDDDAELEEAILEPIMPDMSPDQGCDEPTGERPIFHHAFTNTPQSAVPRPCIVICAMRNFDECKQVIENLRDGKMVLVNVEEMEGRWLQRIIDTLGGAAYSMRADVKKTAGSCYVFAPSNIEVSDKDDGLYTKNTRYMYASGYS